MKKNIYQIVTDRITSELEKGIIPWHRPWKNAQEGAINYVSRKRYTFLNQMMLGKEGEWLTFNQIQQLGGKIRKGSHAGMVVFFTMSNTWTRKEKELDENGNEVERKVQVTSERLFPIIKYYNVFHIDDVEGIESKIKVEESDAEPIAKAEEIISNYVSRESKLTFQNDRPSNRAYYSPLEDKVVVPMLTQYEEAEEYYSTALHELTHSTMHVDRLNRKAESKVASFGDEDYTKEELVAELGSAMLCNIAGLDCEKAFKNSVAYIQGWLKKLKNDNKLIVWASQKAEKSSKYIVNGKK
jgi:antirestriction protein ArdC